MVYPVAHLKEGFHVNIYLAALHQEDHHQEDFPLGLLQVRYLQMDNIKVRMVSVTIKCRAILDHEQTRWLQMTASLL